MKRPKKTPAPDERAVPRSALRRIFRALFPSSPKDPVTRVRHRFIGAACILAIAVLLWELGDDLPPPDVSGGELVNTRFPGDDFVQIQAQPPQSRLQDIPPPLPPTHSADSPDSPDFASDSADQPPSSAAENPDAETPDNDSQAPSAPATPPAADSDAPPEPARDESADSIPDNQFQVGAFRDSNGAEQMARWLRGDGFDAAVQKGQDGIFRVLSGADPKHLAALGYIGQNAADSENPAPEPPEAESGEPSPFVVQLGAFSNEARARKMTARLREQKFAARIEPVRRGGETLFRVRIVGLADRDSAEAVRRRLAALGHGAAQTIDTR